MVKASNAFKSAGKPTEDEPVEEKPVEEEPEKKMTLKGAANLVKAANAFKSAGKPAEDEPVEDKPKKEPEAEAPKLTEEEPVEERATSEVDALDDEEKAMMSGKQEDFRSTKNNDEDAPASAFFTVMKRPRGVMVITSAKQRIIIIHKGHVRYYKTDAKLDTEAPYISTPPQGEIKGGVKGCMITPIVQDTSNCSIRVMVPPSAGKNMHLDLTFSSEEQVANFVDLFEKHKAYYETREVTQAA